MSIQPSASIASASASALALSLRTPAPARPATTSTSQAPVKNDADGDLQHDLATGENPYATSVGATVDAKA